MGLLLLAFFVIAYAMIAKRMAATIVTAPMLFIALGFAMSNIELLAHGQAEAALHLVAEVALIILLFLDAAQIDLKTLRDRHVWPVRMLSLGLPLALDYR